MWLWISKWGHRRQLHPNLLHSYPLFLEVHNQHSAGYLLGDIALDKSTEHYFWMSSLELDPREEPKGGEDVTCLEACSRDNKTTNVFEKTSTVTWGPRRWWNQSSVQCGAQERVWRKWQNQSLPALRERMLPERTPGLPDVQEKPEVRIFRWNLPDSKILTNTTWDEQNVAEPSLAHVIQICNSCPKPLFSTRGDLACLGIFGNV